MQEAQEAHQRPSKREGWPSRGQWDVASLQAFEKLVADTYNRGAIRAPVHLSGGNEEVLIRTFNEFIYPEDWVCSTWRSHYHCLLHGIPPHVLFNDICYGKSITLTYPEHRIITSAIVGGICPIALGIAKAIKLRGDTNKVWCFVGDTCARSGIFWECMQYARGHSLPITFIVEDNDLSVCTNTEEVWGRGTDQVVKSYKYKLPWPHAGAGQRINF